MSSSGAPSPSAPAGGAKTAPAAAGAPASAPAAAATGPAPAPKKKKKASASKPRTKNPKPSSSSTSRKKKPSSSRATSASSAHAIAADGRNARVELAKQRADAAARRADPLWYRVEDCLDSARKSNRSKSSIILPEQIQIVETALGHCNLHRTDVTPQAMACLLEQARRFAQELLLDAEDYAAAAGRAEVTRADMMVAAEARADFENGSNPNYTNGRGITTQLPQLNLMADKLNRKPLPPIPSQCYMGIMLPPKEHQLTARTYDIVSGVHVAQKMVQRVPVAPESKQAAADASKSGPPGYGASRGRQIPVVLKATEKPPSSTNSSATTSATAASAAASAGGPMPMDTSESPSPQKPSSSPSTMPAPINVAPAGETGTKS